MQKADIIKLPTLIRLAARRLWGENLRAKYGEYSDVNFTKFLNEQTSPTRVNQHFGGSHPASVDCKNEYVQGLEAISAYETVDHVGNYIRKFPNALKGRESLRSRFFGFANKPSKAVTSTGRESELDWLIPSEEAQAAE